MTGVFDLPLLEETDAQGHQKFRGASRIIGPQWLHLPTLTIGLLGVQIIWSVEMSYATPYFISLGLSKSKIAIVYIAGAMSGLVVQPLIGALADNCTSRFGRRRPYMMVGTIVCASVMLLFGFTRWFAGIFTGWNNPSNNLLTAWLAVLALCLVEFSVNSVLVVDRALLVDILPPTSQPLGHAWSARMMAIGAVVGFFAGNVDLTKTFPFFGKSQVQTLCVVASFLLFGSHLVTAVLVKERILLPNPDVTGKSTGRSFTQELKDLWSNLLILPRVIRQICFIQFFSWLGWSLVLAYTSIYIGDIYKRSSPVPDTAEARASLDAEAARSGSRALFWSSVVWLISIFVLPVFVTDSASSAGSEQKPNLHLGCDSGDTWWIRLKKLARVPRWMRIDMASLWALSHLVFAVCMFATFFTGSVTGATLMITVTGFPRAVSKWAPFSLLATAILTETSDNDITAVQLSDMWVCPRRIDSGDLDVGAGAEERKAFLLDDALDGDDGNEAEPERREECRRALSSDSNTQVNGARSMNNGDMHQVVSGMSENGMTREVASSGGDLSARAGIILGIHTIFIIVPQLLATGFSSLIFAIFDPKDTDMSQRYHGPVYAPTINGTDMKLVPNSTEPLARFTRSVLLRWLATRQDMSKWTEDDGNATVYEGSNSVVYIFRIAGVTAMVAALLSWRLAQELRHK
ncbi:hypothetical protein P691DRAFT_779866 [Macrolepiota fuliginosa MF-IS2]|uniref:MFS general substrate transporter n=1 Tax=Macrolepiota fuliginosa MF-IS2 TaxID=1400762 RepID=A0A9P5X0L4_9AGAR|nr:hypothetical protein P691DRAFT_779866 [Macrolepiota fuliginosa MF-IS2]